jgi:hypothetical protein
MGGGGLYLAELRAWVRKRTRPIARFVRILVKSSVCIAVPARRSANGDTRCRSPSQLVVATGLFLGSQAAAAAHFGKQTAQVNRLPNETRGTKSGGPLSGREGQAGDDDYGDGCERRVLLSLLQEVPTVVGRRGKHHVEQDEIRWRFSPHAVQRFVAIGDGHNPIAFLAQHRCKSFAMYEISFDNQHTFGDGHAGHPAASCCQGER